MYCPKNVLIDDTGVRFLCSLRVFSCEFVDRVSRLRQSHHNGKTIHEIPRENTKNLVTVGVNLIQICAVEFQKRVKQDVCAISYVFRT